jgi:hypothetical protein
MTSVTVSRGSRSVTFDVYESPGGLHIARDVGKPDSRVYRVGRDDPRYVDNRAPLEAYTVVGQLVGDGAYEDARTLAEDIVKAHSGGTNATLDLSAVSGLTSKAVGFTGDRALRLGYPPGQGEWVSLQLTAMVVGNTIGGTTQGDAGSGQSSVTGEVTLSSDSHSVELVNNIDMERRCGRPDNKSRFTAEDEAYIVDRQRASHDEFELSGLWRTDAATTQDTLVENILKPKLGSGSLTLDFNGHYGLGSYQVAAVDPRSARVSWSAGEAGMVRLESLTLTVVDNQ